MKAQQLLLCTIFLVCLASSATFSINSISSCTSTSPSGFCTRWEQNGSVIETTSCFPQDTQLYVLRDGVIGVTTIGQLKVGDLVQGFDGENVVYSEVIGWLHRGVGVSGEYIRVRVGDGSFLVSEYHNVALEDGSYAFAGELLHKTLHGGQVVQNIEKVTANGIYAPLTRQGTFFIKSSNNKKILAHSFANIRNPKFYQPFVLAIWSGWQTLFGASSTQQIHPAAQWMMDTFSFLIVQ